MPHFTPASERALRHAAQWASRADSDELELPEVLLGLLGEDECRAAVVLARYGIDLGAIRSQWPDLRQLSNGELQTRPFSVAMREAVREAEGRLWAYPRPLTLATEHLLLGIVSAKQEVAEWLIAHGLSPDWLEGEVHRISGHDPSPIPSAGLMETSAEEPATRGMDNLQSETPSLAMNLADIAEGSSLDRPNVQTPITQRESIGVLRAFDASANRGREGLRVLEDFVRFVLDDAHLTRRLKELRHELADAVAAVPASNLYAARETQFDVGVSLSTTAETTRPNPRSLLIANFKRVQESLRSLEEFAKLLAPGVDARLKQLRYQSYTLERATHITYGSLSRLASARLYVLIDGGASPEAFAATAQSLICAGVHILQLRDKGLDDRALVERGLKLRELTRGTNTLFIMNDRPDLAAITQADGVHVGQEELSVKEARAIISPTAMIGVSTHSIEQARQAVLDGADYIGVGPTFPSGTKSFEHFTGVELLQAVAQEIRLPAFAIGGIHQQNVESVLASGISRIAVAGAVTSADNPASAARELLLLIA